jgi:steroid 5-alpha reductase family enzyme
VTAHFRWGDLLAVLPWTALAVVLVLGTTLAVAVRVGRHAVVDVAWGLGFVAVAATAFAVGDGAASRSWLVLLLTAVWGLRLAWHIHGRSRGKGEDPRYAALLARAPGSRLAFAVRRVYLTQGAVMWFVSLPVQVAMASPGSLGALDAVGTLTVAIGLGFESVGDLQLARFKADPANAGRVMDRGLWRYTRHPNYFGDCLAWWGLFAIALSTPAGVYTVLSPVLMTFLLLRVSGVALLERSIGKRRPEYAAYQARTSAFVPLPPRGKRPEER